MSAHASFAVELGIVVAVALATLVYTLGWVSLGAPAVPAMWWCVGIATSLVAERPPLVDLAERSFTGHMLQHLVILCVAAPAVVLSRPIATVGHAVPPRFAIRARRAARRSSGALVLARPATAVLLLVGIHVTAVYEAALRSPIVHLFEHLAFLAAGALLWSAVLAPITRRGPWRVITAFATTASMALLGMVIAASRTPISRTYVARRGLESALADQRLGASLMWVGGMAITMPLAAVALWRWAAAEEREVQRRERLEQTAAGPTDG